MAYRTATTPRRTSWFGQLVSDAHLNDANWYTELAERNAHVDAGATGILDGLDVTQHYTGTFAAPDLTVDVSAGVARDDAGWRLPLATLQNVDCSVDYLGAATTVAAGNHRCLSIFARFEDDYSEIHSIKSGGSAYRIHDDSTVLEVWMGTETLLAAPLDQPALAAGYVLLADVTLINGQTQIVTGDISTTRRQDQVVIAGTPRAIRRGWLVTAIGDVLGWLNAFASVAPGTDGASLVGAEPVAGTSVSLAGVTARAQLTELQAYLDGMRHECCAIRVAAQDLTTGAGAAYPVAFPTEYYDAAGMITPEDAVGKVVTVDAGTDFWTANDHGYVNGDAVYFTTDGALPTSTPQIVIDQPYFVANKTAHTFQIEATPAGGVIDVTNAGGSNNRVHWTQTRFYAPTLASGRYAITAWVEFAANTTGFRELYLETDGGVEFARTKIAATQGGYATCINVVGRLEFSSTDYVRLWAKHLAGAPLNIVNCGIAFERLGNA